MPRSRQKGLLPQAADHAGRSLSDFVVSDAQEGAERTIREQRIITLTAEDSLLFASAVLEPAPPNEKLRAAFTKPRITRYSSAWGHRGARGCH